MAMSKGDQETLDKVLRDIDGLLPDDGKSRVICDIAKTFNPQPSKQDINEYLLSRELPPIREAAECVTAMTESIANW